jgi:hypothetical protein
MRPATLQHYICMESLIDAIDIGSCMAGVFVAEAQVLLCLRTCLRERSGAEATATTPQVRHLAP